MAPLVIEGYVNIGWVCTIAETLGYRRKEVNAWIQFYEKENAREITRIETSRRKKCQRLKRLNDQTGRIFSDNDS